MRHLSLFFGSDVYAAAITLSVFMGGLSLGSWLAEKFVDRLERPLILYGGIEIGIDGPPPGWQTPSPWSWWWHRWGWNVVAGEYAKLLYYRWNY